MLVVGQANYESGDRSLHAAHRVEIHGDRMQLLPALPALAGSPGPLALADMDGDGDLDLFVGGRVAAGRYPEPTTSRLYRNDAGSFVVAQEWPKMGLVSGAVFSDLTGDGFPELIVACEWGPIRVFKNEAGKFTELTEAFGLGQYQGWWNGVATGDFDGDGRLDIVAANWGRNTPQQAFLTDGWRVYYGDFAGRGMVEMIEAFSDRDYQRVVPWRDRDALAQAIPWVRERFTSHAAYSQANVEQVLGSRFQQARELRVNWLDSVVFLNRGDRFVPRPLPLEAQLAPAFAVCVADADGDGQEDVFLSQNFFGVDERSTRHDAGRGLWLRGDGKGQFTALSGQESGVLVYGEQRGAALCDYDGDGRVDLAVSQNGAATKLFHNNRGVPGLRVRLAGPPGNALGIGAVLWVESAAGKGAAREVRAGSGYWSQDSPVQVLAAPAGPAKLFVRWPGGKTTATTFPPRAREISINPAGEAKAIFGVGPRQ